MVKTDKEVLELCKSWFENIMERSDRLTSGNVSHGSRAIYGTAKNCVEYIDEHLHNSNRWKPSDEQMKILEKVKEVDLDNELDFVKDAYYYFTSDERSSMKKVARHFFVLGLNAQKGE